MCVESDECEIEGCSSSDEVHTLSGSMSPALKSSADLHPCKPGQKFRAALLRCRSPLVAAGILSFGNVLNYMDRYTVAVALPLIYSYSHQPTLQKGLSWVSMVEHFVWPSG
uniref:SPNS lysolipid transporter 2, sphingosine-1-phosphate n=1 Tax=Cyprinus carpio carpio TaxID=630221 RepID=A0A9J8BB02_CYPCA